MSFPAPIPDWRKKRGRLGRFTCNECEARVSVWKNYDGDMRVRYKPHVAGSGVTAEATSPNLCAGSNQVVRWEAE